MQGRVLRLQRAAQADLPACSLHAVLVGVNVVSTGTRTGGHQALHCSSVGGCNLRGRQQSRARALGRPQGIGPAQVGTPQGLRAEPTLAGLLAACMLGWVCWHAGQGPWAAQVAGAVQIASGFCVAPGLQSTR